MSKFLVETYYTCTFKITHELNELNEKLLSDVDNRQDGKVEIIDVTVNNRKTKKSDGKTNVKKSDFNKLSKDENIPIQKITLEGQNDNKVLKKDLISHIYDFPEKKIIVVHDMNFSENFLIYIDNIENVSIKENSDEYPKYLDLSRNKITNDLYNTYDNYIKKRYKIDINYQTLDEVKNRFN